MKNLHGLLKNLHVLLILILIPYKLFSDVKVGINFRARSEYWSTILEAPIYDNPYGFVLLRGRTNIDYKYKALILHSTLQGASAINLPDNAFLGPGKSYFDGKINTQNFAIHELYLKVKYKLFDFSLGRTPIKDGEEILYDNEKFNTIKKRSISERLLGNWDWTNLGRRFDGFTLGANTEKVYLWIFGARALAGGINFENAYSPLEIFTGGGAINLKKDTIKNTEVRFFDIVYQDQRGIVKDTLGKQIFINTFGISVISLNKISDGESDFVLWGAYQIGNFGEKKQQAFSFIGEVGYEFGTLPFKPWARIGLAYASGEKNPTDNKNTRFFNILPTNHKYYGYLDIFAFSNLQDLYLQILIPYDILKFELALHNFSLASKEDKWIYGSGAFSKDKLGYSEINYNGKSIGNEIDIVIHVNPNNWFSFTGGFSIFFGSKNLEDIFPQKRNMTWLYSQILLKF